MVVPESIKAEKGKSPVLDISPSKGTITSTSNNKYLIIENADPPFVFLPTEQHKYGSTLQNFAATVDGDVCPSDQFVCTICIILIYNFISYL